MSKPDSKPSIKWWIQLIIGILGAIAGMITENATDFLSNLIKF